MEHLIEILDYEMERIDKIIKEHGKDHRVTREQYQYTLGIMAGMLLSRSINETIYNKYGRIIKDIINQTN
jgi:hypothetical protein